MIGTLLTLLAVHLEGLLYFLLALLLIAGSNIMAMRRFGKLKKPAAPPRVSILVPARDEELNIHRCITSLLAQDYPDFQVIALDDHSTDRTLTILNELAATDIRLTVLSGKDLPAGWLGKHWACHQLSQAADGEWLLFTDADTVHRPETVSQAVSAATLTGAHMLSALVRQEVGSWAERLAVPVMNWSIFSIFPFMLVHSLRLPFLAIANGQFLLFTRQAYQKLGGHAAIRSDPVDDIALARTAARLGVRWRMVDATGLVACRMYRHRKQVIEGFTKNLYATFGKILPLYLFVWVWLVVLFLEPLVLAAWGVIFIIGGGSPSAQQIYILQLSTAAILLSLFQWSLVYWRLRFPIKLAWLYPASVVFFAGLAFRSLVFSLARKTTWKGRIIHSP